MYTYKEIKAAYGFNTDHETKSAIDRILSRIQKADEIHEGKSYRLTTIDGEELLINSDEMNYVCRRAKESGPNCDFDIYMVSGDDKTASEW